MNSKKLKLKARDMFNKITGKDKVIEQYNELTHEIAASSDKEENPEKKKDLMKLYKDVTDEKWVNDEKGGCYSDDYNPYKLKNSKKKTRAKIDMARMGLEKINGKSY